MALRFIEGCEAGEAPIPALFILDLSVPRVTGQELLDRIRNSPVLAAVPVVVMSASDSPADQERIVNRQAVFFPKPSKLDEFMALGPLIKKLIGQVGPSEWIRIFRQSGSASRRPVFPPPASAGAGRQTW